MNIPISGAGNTAEYGKTIQSGQWIKPKIAEKPIFAAIVHKYELLIGQLEFSLPMVGENLSNSGIKHLEVKLNSIIKWLNDAKNIHAHIKNSAEYTDASASKHEQARLMTEKLEYSIKIMEKKHITVTEHIKHKTA